MTRRSPLAAAAALSFALAALSSRAASFDCAKAQSVAEKSICASPRLSRLDTELARSYDLASTLTVDPKGLLATQREWLRGTRSDCGDDAECLEHAMLVRIEQLRWAPESGVKLFADQQPPPSIFGRYSETEPACVYTGKGDEMECSGDAESYFDLRPGKGNRVLVRSELTFFNGHMCDFEAEGEWAGDELRVPVVGSGHPLADVMLLKYAPQPQEIQEGVAFFGRAGAAVLKSLQRLNVDPLAIYGTNCLKFGTEDPADAADWLTRELHIVQPKLVVAMGGESVAFLGELEFPLSDRLDPDATGVIQRFTPTVQALVTPDIDEALDETPAKNAFWNAFKALGPWWAEQPPY